MNVIALVLAIIGALALVAVIAMSFGCCAMMPGSAGMMSAMMGGMMGGGMLAILLIGALVTALLVALILSVVRRKQE